MLRAVAEKYEAVQTAKRELNAAIAAAFPIGERRRYRHGRSIISVVVRKVYEDRIFVYSPETGKEYLVAHYRFVDDDVR